VLTRRGKRKALGIAERGDNKVRKKKKRGSGLGKKQTGNDALLRKTHPGLINRNEGGGAWKLVKGQGLTYRPDSA